MGRSGYTDDEDYDGQFAMWRGAVASSIRGKRGQAFLKEMAAAMDAMPVKRLTANALRTGLGIEVEEVWDDQMPGEWRDANGVVHTYNGNYRRLVTHCAAANYHAGAPLTETSVCAIGTVGEVRGVLMERLDPEDSYQVAAAFDISRPLACEIQYMNDEGSIGIREPDPDRPGSYRYRPETPEERWIRMRAWIASKIKGDPSTPSRARGV